MKTPPPIPRPRYPVTRLATALAWHWRGFHLSEKLDGCWHQLTIENSVAVGEILPDGRFFAFDLPVYRGADIRRRPTAERFAILDSLRLPRPATPRDSQTPAQFIQSILAAGGEGIVAKDLDAPFGVNTFKVKRAETFDCRVTEKHPSKMSLHLSLDGADAGWCPALYGAFDRVAVGDVVEVECFARHPSGKFREPRFVRVRTDMERTNGN